MNVRQLAARVEQIGQPKQANAPPKAAEPKGPSFSELLRRAGQSEGPPGLQISAHARQRMEERGIPMDAAAEAALSKALTDLDAKGARDALLLRSDAAFVVNVPNRTLVTAIGREEMAERIFTQIDSAMIV
jgi:flagellar operon protein